MSSALSDTITPMKNPYLRTKKYIISHKIVSIIAIIILIGGGYLVYKKFISPTASPQYVQGKARIGTISQTVTGSGQVSSENQLDITSEVSAKIVSINAKVGQMVKTGDLIATLDSRDALIDLENARIAYAKLTEPAKVGDITNAENNLAKAYSDSYSAISTTFVHIPNIMSGLKDLLYSREGYLSDQQTPYFTQTGRSYLQTTGSIYGSVNQKYSSILAEYATISKTSPPALIESMVQKTYDFMKDLTEALKASQATITFISVSQSEYNPSGAVSSASNITTWLSQANSDLTNLLSSKNAIASYSDTLKKLRDGADKLDIQSEQLTLQQKERSYAKYFIRAPFEGIVGRIPVKVYDQVNNGTIIATVSSNRKITTIPLNEVDAVKVAKGQKTRLTLDAIQGLKLEGTVDEVDLVGTASQGVVTYNIKIAFDGSDTRIRPGMSIDTTVITKEKTGVLIVPSSSIKTQGKGAQLQHYVETLATLGSLEKKMVTIGESDDTNTEIISGLNEGEQVVVKVLPAGSKSSSSSTPTLFSGLGNGQRNAIRNANR